MSETQLELQQGTPTMTRFGRGSNSNRLVIHTPDGKPLIIDSKPTTHCRFEAEYNGTTLAIECIPCDSHGCHLHVKMFSAEGFGSFEFQPVDSNYTWEHLLKSVLKEVNDRLFQLAANQIIYLKSEDKYYVN